MVTKPCIHCGAEKALDQFYRHSMMADGHLNKCKDCARKEVRNRRLSDPEKVRAYDRERSNLPHRKALRKAIVDRQPPERTKARYAVSNAVRDGRLAKGPCAFCHSTSAVEAHHHDYSKPLDVTWLCKPCHRRFHALERMATYRDVA